MKKIFKSKYIFSLFLSAILFSACKDENEFPVDKSYERMFRPHTLLATEVKATSAMLEWPLVKGTSRYILELALDANFQNIIKKVEINPEEVEIPVTTNGLSFTFIDLEDLTEYSARIKVTGKNGVPDSEYSMVTFTTPEDQIMLPVTNLDYTKVTLNWVAGLEVTHINFTPEGQAVQKIQLTTEEKAKGTKSLTGLSQGTNFAVEIYNTDENKRGSISFVTPELNLPPADQIIFLAKTDVLNQATIDTLTKSTVFVLRTGGIYGNNSALVLKKNLSIAFYGEPISPQPILAWNVVTLPEVAGTIRFENLDITGYQYENGVETTTKRSYIFNQNLPSQTEAVIFENCKIRNLNNTPFRLQGSNTITIEKLIFNKCIAFDCGVSADGKGSYAFVHSTVATGKVNNIEITNSTFFNIGLGLILHNGIGSQSLKVEKCTFNDVIGDGRYFIDYNANTVNSISLTNFVIGKSKSAAGTAKGIRIAGSGVTVTSSYKTSDFVVNDQASSIGGLIEYTKLSTDLFKDPAKGDFNFKDQNFAGKGVAGDPRWK